MNVDSQSELLAEAHEFIGELPNGYETEAAMQRSLEHLSANRNPIIIAQRLLTVRHADRIYANLWLVQTGEAVHRHS